MERAKHLNLPCESPFTVDSDAVLQFVLTYSFTVRFNNFSQATTLRCHLLSATLLCRMSRPLKLSIRVVSSHWSKSVSHGLVTYDFVRLTNNTMTNFPEREEVTVSSVVVCHYAAAKNYILQGQEH